MHVLADKERRQQVAGDFRDYIESLVLHAQAQLAPNKALLLAWLAAELHPAHGRAQAGDCRLHAAVLEHAAHLIECVLFCIASLEANDQQRAVAPAFKASQPRAEPLRAPRGCASLHTHIIANPKVYVGQVGFNEIFWRVGIGKAPAMHQQSVAPYSGSVSTNGRPHLANCEREVRATDAYCVVIVGM